MPPFQYSAPDNRSANSIAALMLRPGEIEAQKATAIGNAQAQAAQASGQAWAGAAQQIGQSVAGVTQQLADPKVQEWKRAQAGRAVLASGIKQFTDPKTGETNHEQVAQFVAKNGYPDQAESWLKMTTSTQEALANLRKSTQAHAQEQMAAIGDLAFHAQTAEDFNSALGLAATGGLIDEAGAHKFAAQADAAGPEGWLAQKARLQQFSPTWKTQQAERAKPVKVGEGDKVVIPSETPGQPGEVIAEGGAKPKTEAQLALEAGGDAAGAMRLLKPPPQPESATTKSLLVDGKPTELTWEPKSKKWLDASGKEIENAAARIKPMPPASVQVFNQQAAQFAGQDGEVDPTVKAIAEYRQAPPSIGRPGTQAIMAAVNRYNPAYDATQYQTRQRVRTDYTTGTQGQQLDAVNTAIMHMDLLADAADALKNGNFKPGNAAYNSFVSLFGSAAPNNYDTIKEFLDGEVGSVVKKGVATEGEMGRLEKKGGSQSSADQMAGYIKSAMKILAGKAVVLDDKYHKVMGTTDPFTAISDRSAAVLAKHGFNPAEFGGHGDGAGGGDVRQKAATVLAGAGKANDATAIDAFLKNNPGFK